jgi:hypothetical protein
MTVKGALLKKVDNTEKNAQKTRLILSRIQVVFPEHLFLGFFLLLFLGITTYFAADFIVVRLSFCPLPFKIARNFPALHPPTGVF